jgi:hypothetical protein
MRLAFWLRFPLPRLAGAADRFVRRAPPGA